MNQKEIMELLEGKINTCYLSLKSSRSEKFPELYIEGFRCRLDELILLHQIIKNQSFMKSCEELNIEYSEVDCFSKVGEEQKGK